MKIEGRIRVKAQRQELWDFLINPETLAYCVPGCESVELRGDNKYESVVTQRVGPIKVRLKFETVLTEMTPPMHLKAEAKGSDILLNACTFNQITIVDINEVSADEVELVYCSNVSLVGRLANFGDRILRAKAKKVGAEFAETLRNRITTQCIK